MPAKVTTADRPRRADARRNRERLLEAARREFARSGADVPLAAVARAAGVGVGTAYRHFPTHEALVEAVYRDEVARFCAAAAGLGRDHPPDVALERWLHLLVGHLATKRGMADALAAVVASGSSVYADARAQIVATLSGLLAAGAAAGTVRADVDAQDVVVAIAGVALTPEDPERAHRVLGLVMDGLRQVERGQAAGRRPPRGHDDDTGGAG